MVELHDIIIQNLKLLFDFLDGGGMLFMTPLMILCILMWYGIGYRYAILKKMSKRGIKDLIHHPNLGRYVGRHDSFEHPFKKVLFSVGTDTQSTEEVASLIDQTLLKLERELAQYRQLIRIIIIVAPLIGLLGTVDGMIEMFDSLVEGQLFGQSGGIAAGISKALSTTEFGLIIASPGIIFQHLLNRREKRIREEFYQAKYYILSTFGNRVKGE